MAGNLAKCFFVPGLCILLAACGDGAETPVPVQAEVQDAAAPAATMAADCSTGAGIEYVCGVINGEDILPLGDTPWLLVSGMNGSLSGSNDNGRLHLVNRIDRSVGILFPGANPVYQQDSELFAGCPGPVDATNFSAHGLSLRKIAQGPEIYHLYMTSHGAREAIEVFEVDAFVTPVIKWIGCIPMPATSWTNSVAILNDGGFVATQFYDPARHSIQDVLAGTVTGHVFAWHPGGEVTVIPGTEMSGANGIVISGDERWLFVSSFGTGEVIRFDLGTTPPSRDVVPVGVLPDNIRWTPQGTLYTAGNNTGNFCGRPPCAAGWGVVEITPDTLVATRIAAAGENSALHDPSVGQRIGDEIWIGTFNGDRLAIMPAP